MKFSLLYSRRNNRPRLARHLLTLFCLCFASPATADEADFLSFRFWKTASLEQVSSAIEQGADVNARDKTGVNPLMFAAGYSHTPEIITYLIKQGADLKTRDIIGGTILMAAAGHNQEPDIITRLIKHGADIEAIDNVGKTALMFAAGYNRNPDIILRLIKHGADINAKDKDGKTALDFAKRNRVAKGGSAYRTLSDAINNQSGN
jgi:ankyrin repeat protein